MASLLCVVPPVPVLRVQLLASGWARRRLDRAIARGDLRYVLPGVLLRSDVPLDLAKRARAAALVLPDGTVLARRTAAWLMGIDVLPPGGHLEMPPVDTVVAAAGAILGVTGWPGARRASRRWTYSCSSAYR